jgi:Flp pilus assembly protein TadG
VRSIQSFKADHRGGAAVLFALALVPLLAAAGMGLDYSRAALARNVLQGELDAAVLAGASKSEGERKAAAEAMFDSYPRADGIEIVRRAFSPTGQDLRGEVVATVRTTLMGIIAIDQMTVNVQSSAQSQGAPVCILVNNPTASQALLVNSGVNILAPDCEMHVRSKGTTAAMINNGQNINMQRVCIRSRSVTQNGGAVAAVETDCAAIDNPFAGKLPAVSVPSFPANNCSSPGSNFNGQNNALTVGPGNYCGGMNFNGNFRSVTFEKGNYRGINAPGAEAITFAGGGVESVNFNGTPKTVTLGPGHYKGINLSGQTINLSPGTYENVTINGNPVAINLKPGLYIWKSKFTLNSGVMSGEGVTIYYPDKDSYLMVNSGALNLSAPNSGTYSGILFFEPDGLAASSFTINSNSKQVLNGLIYWPSRAVTFNSSSTILSDKISLIVDKVVLNGGLDWRFSAAAKGMTSSSGGVTRLTQ